MKRISLLIIAITAIIIAYAQTPKPDFAFPKTVALNATTDLSKAQKEHDAHAALNALIRLYVSETLIDPDNAQAQISKAQEVAKEFRGDKLYGMFPALIAYMYNDYYQRNRWKVNKRDTPLTPLPEDLSEWSGEQLTQRIKDLCEESMNADNTADLGKIEIGKYSDIITFDKTTKIYYPTLKEFVFQNAINLTTSDNATQEKILNKILSDTKTGTPSAIAWTIQTDKFNEDTKSAISTCIDNENNPYAGLLYATLCDNYTLTQTEDAKQFCESAKTYLKRYPSTPFKNQIQTTINELTRVTIRVDVPKMCGVGTDVKIKIANANATQCEIKIYYTPTPITTKIGKKNIDPINTLITSKAQCQTYTLTFPGQNPPFETDTILTHTLDKPGYYTIIPALPGKIDKKDYGYITQIRCVPVYPIAIYDNDFADIVVTNAHDGAPISGCDVKLTTRDRQQVACGKTNTEGIINVKDKILPKNTYNITLNYQNESYAFDNATIYTNTDDNAKTTYNATILTDRSLYHPGEKVDILAVVTQTLRTSTSKNDIASMSCPNRTTTLTLKDANGKKVTSATLTTDTYGRATATMDLPAEGLTGRFSLQLIDKETNYHLATRTIMVSDYKMPDFETTITEIGCDTPTPGEVTIKGQAITYSGVPLSDTQIALTISETTWGWWRMRNNGTRLYSTEATTTTDGTYTIIIPDSVFTNRHAIYQADVTATSPSGSTAEATKTFSLTKQYQITLNKTQANIDGAQKWAPDVKVYAPDGNTADIPTKWALLSDTTTIAQGHVSDAIDLSKIKPATYTLQITTADPTLAEPYTTKVTIYNADTKTVPDQAILYVPIIQYNVGADGKAKILIGTSNDNNYIYKTITTDKGTSHPTYIRTTTGYHEIEATLPNGCQEATIYLSYVLDCRISTQKVTLKRTKDTKLKIEGETFRDNLIPTENETWKIRIVNADGSPVRSALALDMYNKALDAIYPHTFRLNFPSNARAPYLNISAPSTWDINNTLNKAYEELKFETFVKPAYNFYDYGVRDLYYPLRSVNALKLTMDGTQMEMNDMKSEIAYAAGDIEEEPASARDEATTTDTLNSENASPQDTFDYRDSETAMAIWAPTLTTDEQGNINYTFTVPNANTTWRLNAVAWTQDLEYGALMRDFVANKPVMVQPNQPRFLRQGDYAILAATIINNTDTTQTITTVAEIFDPLTNALLVTKTHTNTIEGRQNAVVKINVNVPDDATAIGYRVKSTNGTYSDGEQNVIRVLDSEATLIETTPFYLNPGDTEFKTTLPTNKDARITLTYCENPAWSIVSALPGLRTTINDYATSAAAALYSASVAKGIIEDNPTIREAIEEWTNNPTDSALISTLQKNEDLKIAVLNSTPWVQAAQSQTERMANLALIFDDKETDASISKAIKILKDLQTPDGGFKWGKWCDKPSEWTTANVLAIIANLKETGWMPTDPTLIDIIDKAVYAYDNMVEDTDIIYCITRPAFDIPMNSNGKKVVKATLGDISKNWKKYTDPSYKAMAAEALYANGEKALATTLMKSISEFGVYTKDQGLKFPSVTALYSYANILQAYAKICPDSKEVDGLRQQLIVRKQGTDWGNSTVTTQVIKSILCSGTKWTVGAKGATITAGTTHIQPQGAIETATGALRADLTPYGGTTLTIVTPGTGPSYGAIYAQFNQAIDSVQSHSCDDLSIEKRLYVLRGTKWANIDTPLKVGDKIKEQLTIHSKRDLQYVEIIDDRAATLQPISQLPGWMWSEGIGFYRENLDTATHLHVEYMPAGTYLLSYEMQVGLSGTYQSGVATIQSQYAPEISAHSSGTTISVE